MPQTDQKTGANSRFWDDMYIDPEEVVSYTLDETIGARFKAAGLQIATGSKSEHFFLVVDERMRYHVVSGVPFQLGEDEFSVPLSTPTETFRLRPLRAG
jgi:hypothetical protein